MFPKWTVRVMVYVMLFAMLSSVVLFTISMLME